MSLTFSTAYMHKTVCLIKAQIGADGINSDLLFERDHLADLIIRSQTKTLSEIGELKIVFNEEYEKGCNSARCKPTSTVSY
jgi:hypothetical protein